MPTMVSGFTLVETMVAITILLIAVVGPMSAIGGSLSQISTARDQMIAVNLAQEGIEVVRQKRDSNMLARWEEQSRITPPLTLTLWSAELSVGDYIVDPTTIPPTLFRCGVVDSCSPTQKSIYQENVPVMYQQFAAAPGSGYVQTKFSRVVSITDISSPEKKVTSTVTWKTSGGIDKTITVSESIFGINS